MSRPAPRVDIAFDSTYSTEAADRTWTDVTDYVMTSSGININHGRQDEHSQAGANTCSLTLNNSDGRFTPGLVSGAYYPNVKIGRPLRVSSNLCSFGDWGTFEANVTGWTGIDASVARITSAAHSGSAALEVTSTLGGANMSANTPGTTSGVPVIPAAAYRASAWVRRPVSSTNRTCDIRVVWADSGGSTISTDTSASITDSGTWQQVAFDVTAPASAAYARVRVTWSSTALGEVHHLDDVRFDVDRFVGYVDEWPLEWPGVVDTFATSTITASSRMARLGLSNPLRSVIETEILLDAPDAYYTMGEAEGATRANDSSGNGAPPLSAENYPDSYPNQSAPVFGTATGPGTDGLTAVQFTGAAGSSSKILRADGDSASFGAVEFFFSADGSSFNETVLFSAGPPRVQNLIVGVDTGEDLRVYHGVGDTLVDSNVNDGVVRHVCVTYDGADIRAYVDGVLAATVAVAVDAFSTYFIGPAAGDAASAVVGLSHLALYEVAPSATRIAAHAEAGLTGFADEAAVDRLERYAGYAGIPAAESSFSSEAVTPMAHIDTTDKGAVELMQTVATTDGGVLYDGADGALAYEARTARYNAAAALTLDVDASEVEVGYVPKLDRSALINKLTATLSDGTYSVTAVNTTSVEEYGAHGPGDLELATTDTDQAHAAAWWRVNTYGEPSARAPQLSVELAKMTAARHAEVLAVKVSEKITVSNLPAQSDSSSKSFFVEGYTETITDSLHRLEFNVSPTTGFDVWEVGHATYGVYDTYPLSY